MSKVGLYVSCETCGKTARVEAQDSLGIAKVGYDLDCGHRNGWDPRNEGPEFASPIKRDPSFPPGDGLKS